MRTVIIGDLHGDWWGLRAILRATGVTDESGERIAPLSGGGRYALVIQLGDVIHGGQPRHIPRAGVDDTRCALLALDRCDYIIVGNHELPHLWPAAGFPRFAGMGTLADPARVALLEGFAAGQVIPAHAHEGWLLTHSGLHHRRRRSERLPGDAGEVALGIADRFAARVRGRRPRPLFDAIGPSRGGADEAGGIFWCDWGELAECYAAAPGVSQIVGHTPQGAAPTLRRRGGDPASMVGNLWCVDVGAARSGRVAALVQDESGAAWRPVIALSEWGRP